MTFVIRNKDYKRQGFRPVAIIEGGDKNGKRVFLNDTLESKQDCVKLDKGKFMTLPDANMVKNDIRTEKVYVAGSSGSGKSFYISKWLKLFLKKKRKDMPVYIFSTIDYDRSLDDIFADNIIRLEIDIGLITSPIHPSELSDSIVIFDDSDNIPDARVRKTVQNLRSQILECGRHYGITMLNTSHQLLNYMMTRTLLLESTQVVFFPRSSAGTKHIKAYLTNYGGLDKEQISKILKLNSRWVAHMRCYNPYIISEKEIYMLKDED